MKTAIVVPCYNEAATIGAVAAGAGRFGDVFVINDGSSDKSADLARAAGAEVVTTEGGLGYDNVIELGLRHCYDLGYEAILTIDGDGEHNPERCGEVCAALEGGAPLALGHRPAPQRLAEWAVVLWCRARYGIRDVLCGMKGFTRPVLAAYFADGRPNTCHTFTALVWVHGGGRFSQMPIDGTPRQDQPRYGSLIRANIKILKLLGPILTIGRKPG